MITKQDKRISEIIDSKEFKSIRPINATTREKIRKRHSRYMFFYNKDAIHGTCERCGGNVSYSEKTRYKAKVWCPHCNSEMEVMHTWRKPGGCDYTIEWDMDVKAISNEVFVIRYIMTHQFKSWEMNIGEVAREVFDFRTAKRYKLSTHIVNDGHGNRERIWHTANDYFVEFNMYVQRRDYCQSAKPVFTESKLFKELGKIDALDYYDWKSKIGTFYLLSDDLNGLLSAPLYEKMEKVGLGELAKSDFGYSQISWNPKETSIVRMLRLDKKHYNLFMEQPSRTALGFLQMYRKIPEADYRWCRDNDEFDLYRRLRMLGLKHPITAIKYMERNKVRNYDYFDYLDLLKNKLKYDMNDKYYIYPKDLYKAKENGRREYQVKLENEKREIMNKKNEKIKAISDALRKMPNLKEFLDGSRGFLVCVPETGDEFIEEGRIQHSCVAQYIDRVAEKKTLVFFIRKLDCPDAPFITMEYCNGDVIQARYGGSGQPSVYDEEVRDDNIISFVDAFADALRKSKVMVA